MANTFLAGATAAATSPTDDELVAINHHLLVPLTVTLAAGQNLKRGALLGAVTAGGQYKLSASAAGDGSQAPMAVLVHDADTTAAAAPVEVYLRGDFNQDVLTFGAGHTPTSVRAALHDTGIVFHKRYGAPV